MIDHPKPSLTADAVVLAGQGNEMTLLAIERDRPPFAGRVALPGGFVDPFEAPQRAVLRELAEETGLRLPPGRGAALTLRARQGRDPRGWTVTQPYVFWLPEPVAVTAGDDARRAFWRPLADLGAMAFDHGAILCEALGKFWRMMPGGAPALRSARAFGEPDWDASESVVFFGGSFNPWHEGHDACLHLFPKTERLVVTPDASPFKSAAGPGCFWLRWRALQDRLAQPGRAVFPGFCGMEAVNPTASWLPLVETQVKALLVGDDNLASLPRWIDADRLAKALDLLYVAPRNAVAADLAKARAWLARINPACKVIDLEDHPFRRVSSTALRQRTDS